MLNKYLAIIVTLILLWTANITGQNRYYQILDSLENELFLKSGDTIEFSFNDYQKNEYYIKASIPNVNNIKVFRWGLELRKANDTTIHNRLIEIIHRWNTKYSNEWFQVEIQIPHEMGGMYKNYSKDQRVTLGMLEMNRLLIQMNIENWAGKRRYETFRDLYLDIWDVKSPKRIDNKSLFISDIGKNRFYCDVEYQPINIIKEHTSEWENYVFEELESAVILQNEIFNNGTSRVKHFYNITLTNLSERYDSTKVLNLFKKAKDSFFIINSASINEINKVGMYRVLSKWQYKDAIDFLLNDYFSNDYVENQKDGCYYLLQRSQMGRLMLYERVVDEVSKDINPSRQKVIIEDFIKYSYEGGYKVKALKKMKTIVKTASNIEIINRYLKLDTENK